MQQVGENVAMPNSAVDFEPTNLLLLTILDRPENHYLSLLSCVFFVFILSVFLQRPSASTKDWTCIVYVFTTVLPI